VRRQLVGELAAMVARHAATRILPRSMAPERYARFVWDLGREEGVVLPAAERHLTAEDWAEIDAAFSQNRDPRFGGDTDAEFRRLFSRIAQLST
jgi:hypothetical protein